MTNRRICNISITPGAVSGAGSAYLFPDLTFDFESGLCCLIYYFLRIILLTIVSVLLFFVYLFIVLLVFL